MIQHYFPGSLPEIPPNILWILVITGVVISVIITLLQIYHNRKDDNAP